MLFWQTIKIVLQNDINIQIVHIPWAQTIFKTLSYDPTEFKDLEIQWGKLLQSSNQVYYHKVPSFICKEEETPGLCFDSRETTKIIITNNYHISWMMICLIN